MRSVLAVLTITLFDTVTGPKSPCYVIASSQSRVRTLNYEIG